VQSILFTPARQNFTITLEEGWNLISLPLVPEKNQVQQLMGGVADGVESVWGYSDGQWQTYVPLHPESSDLISMTAGRGYWIKVNQAGLSLQFQGKLTDLSMPLKEGWNLVGFNSIQVRPVSEILSEMGITPETIWGYNNGQWQMYNPAIPGASDLESFEPGRGYWIKI
jgi:hypothetical protein